MKEEDNKIVEIVNETGLGNPQAEFIVKKFKPLFEDAKKLILESQDIVVSNASEIENMAKARRTRLALKDIRVSAQKVKKELKEDVLKYGNAVQGVFNLIESAIVPAEEYLEKQERYAKLLEEEQAKTLKEKRINEISKYVEDYTIYNFDNMSDEAFSALVASVKRDFEEKKDKEEKAEKERLAELKKKEEEDEKMRIENAKLKKEKEEKELAEKKEKEERERKQKEEDEKRKQEQKKKDEEHAKELEKERIEKERVAAELKKKEDEEKKRIEEEKRMVAEKAEKERQAKLAPEKDKLTEYSEAIRTIRSPEGLSKAGLEVVKIAEAKLLAISQEIKLKIKEL